MDTLDIRNLQLSYQAVYDGVLCESMEELGIIGEARDGYGDDSKFNKPDDKIEKPGTTVPKPKKGGYGRISRSTPYGIGAHANRTASRVTTIVGEDPGAPRSEKMAREVSKKKGPKMVKKDGKWVKEALDYYDMILEYLLDEGYAETVENAEAIMVNMSEEWVGDIMEGYKSLPAKKMLKKAGDHNFYAGWIQGEWETNRYNKWNKKPITKKMVGDATKKANKIYDTVLTHDPDVAKSKSRYKPNRKMEEGFKVLDYYDIILEYLIYEGYADTVENAEAIMVNMSEEWVGDIVEGYKTLPIGKMMKQAARKIKTAEKKRSDAGWPAEIAGEPNWMTRKALKDVDKMARVASRHSLIKGKGRVRGEGQAELNRRRGES